MRYRLTVLLVLLLALAALAAAPDLLRSGEFAAAWRAGSRSGDLAGLLAAAEAANLMAQYRAASDEERRVWLERAQEAARRAIELDPKSAEAYYQLAQAQAEIIRFVGVWSKITLASAIKENLDACLRLNPAHARAHAGLALWNLQLAKRGLGWLYGASLAKVRPLMEAAIALDPYDVEIRKNYGFALIKLADYPAARLQLQTALSLPVHDAADELHLARAAELLRRLPNAE